MLNFEVLGYGAMTKAATPPEDPRGNEEETFAVSDMAGAS